MDNVKGRYESGMRRGMRDVVVEGSLIQSEGIKATNKQQRTEIGKMSEYTHVREREAREKGTAS
jgi:hypothetical protein